VGREGYLHPESTDYVVGHGPGQWLEWPRALPELPVDHQRGQAMDGGPGTEGELFRIPAPYHARRLAVPNGTDEEPVRRRGGRLETRMRGAIDRHAPEHDAEVRGVPGGEFDVGPPEGSQPSRRVVPMGRRAAFHRFRYCAEAFLSDGREQGLLVPEVTVGRGLRNPGAPRRAPEGQRIGPGLIDQRQRRVA
jgi:hypothetical protein